MATKRKGPALSEEELLAATGHDPESELRDSLSRKGYLVVKQERVTGIRERIDTNTLHGDWVRLGLVADMHFGSQHQQLTHLHKAYRLFDEEGITTVLNAGDIVDGQRVYHGQEFELFSHGVDAQVDYAIKNYPHEEGITTYFISGNHDESHWKHAGVDIGKPIAAAREDMKYLCVGGATVTIPDDPKTGVDIYLCHPIGAVAYARSFKPQKRIEQFASEQKPKIAIWGHWHCQDVLPMYRNVYSVMMPCFQSQTSYLKALGLNPEIGSVILEYMPDGEGGVSRIRHEFVPAFRPIKNDY